MSQPTLATDPTLMVFFGDPDRTVFLNALWIQVGYFYVGSLVSFLDYPSSRMEGFHLVYLGSWVFCKRLTLIVFVPKAQ